MTRWLGFSGLPIRLKLLASAVIVQLPISWFISFYFPRREEAIALAAMARRTTNMAELVALGVGRGIRLNDYSDVASAVKWVKQDPHLAYVVVVDSAGEVFASHNPRRGTLDPAHEVSAAPLREEGGLLRAVVPIIFDGKREGTLLLGTSLDGVSDQIAKERRIALAVSLGVFLFGVVASRLFAHRITRPIIELRGAAESVAQGDYDVTTPTSDRDEVGALVAAFGTMVGNLRESTTRANQMVGDLGGAETKRSPRARRRLNSSRP